MKFLLALASLLAVSVAQVSYDCAPPMNCDSFAEREDRTGCRFMCNLDQGTGDMVLDEFDMDNTFDDTWACGAGCDLVAFRSAIQDVLQVCDLEVSRGFVMLAMTDNTTDPGIIDRSDKQQFRRNIEVDHGNGIFDEEAFQRWWAVDYLLLVDPNCTVGY